jgi:tetratricopeptide (TPR) repeat protein
MRRVAAILLVASCVAPRAARAQDAYAAVLLEYLTGDADHALIRLLTLPTAEVRAGVDGFEMTRSQLVLTGAAAMHTEAAFRRDGGFASEFHLQIATALVEFGEPVRGAKTNTPISVRPRFAAPVSDEFRRLWYCAVIQGLTSNVMLTRADKYLVRALALYPHHPELRMLAGVTDEMHASPRTSAAGPADRRRALEQAERHFRAVIAAEPERLEAQLRLGRILERRGRFTEASAVLSPLVDAADARLAYLAALFLGGIEDRGHRPDQALALYERAAARLPQAQAARLAASELRHRRGDRQAAADAIPAAAGAGNAFDPWWTYIFGEYWRGEMLLNAVRAKRHG